MRFKRFFDLSGREFVFVALLLLWSVEVGAPSDGIICKVNTQRNNRKRKPSIFVIVRELLNDRQYFLRRTTTN